MSGFKQIAEEFGNMIQPQAVQGGEETSAVDDKAEAGPSTSASASTDAVSTSATPVAIQIAKVRKLLEESTKKQPAILKEIEDFLSEKRKEIKAFNTIHLPPFEKAVEKFVVERILLFIQILSNMIKIGAENKKSLDQLMSNIRNILDNFTGPHYALLSKELKEIDFFNITFEKLDDLLKRYQHFRLDESENLQLIDTFYKSIESFNAIIDYPPEVMDGMVLERQALTPTLSRKEFQTACVGFDLLLANKQTSKKESNAAPKAEGSELWSAVIHLNIVLLYNLALTIGKSTPNNHITWKMYNTVYRELDAGENPTKEGVIQYLQKNFSLCKKDIPLQYLLDKIKNIIFTSTLNLAGQFSDDNFHQIEEHLHLFFNPMSSVTSLTVPVNPPFLVQRTSRGNC